MSSTPAVLIRRGYLRFAQLQEHLAALAIAWPDCVSCVSAKDEALPLLRDARDA